MNHRSGSRFTPDRDTTAIIACVLAGLILRLILAPLGAHPGDLPVFIRWAEAIHQHGWIGVYAASDANYPPLGMALIALSQSIFQTFLPVLPIGGPAWLILLKLPAILADTLLMILAARLAHGRPHAIAITASLALNPALILMSAWWGQLDSVYVALAAAGVVAMLDDHPLLSGLLAGAAVMVKVQAVFFLPLLLIRTGFLPSPTGRGAGGEGATQRVPVHKRILLASLRSRRSLLLTVSGVAAAITLPLMPFAFTGQLALVGARIVSLVAAPGWLTVNALNVWFLISGGRGNWGFNAPLLWPDTNPLFLGISPRTLGVLLLTLWCATVLILTHCARHDPASFLAGLLLSVGIFLFPTQSHERYALGAVAFAALYAAAASAVAVLPSSTKQPAISGCQLPRRAGGEGPAQPASVGNSTRSPTSTVLRIHKRVETALLPSPVRGGAGGEGSPQELPIPQSRRSEMLMRAQDFRNWRGFTLYAMITVLVTLNLCWAAPPIPALRGFARSLPIGLLIAVGFVLVAGWGLRELGRYWKSGWDNARPD